MGGEKGGSVYTELAFTTCSLPAGSEAAILLGAPSRSGPWDLSAAPSTAVISCSL